MHSTKLNFLFLLVTFAIAETGLAQTFPVKDTPKQMTLETVQADALLYKESCGFTSVFIQSSDLRELLAVKNCVGVRFYIAMEDPKQRFADVIAVAINGDGKEIGDFLERKYHLAKALDAHYPDEFQKMNLAAAKKAVADLQNGVAGYAPFAAFLSRESLNALLNTANASGVRVFASGFQSGSEALRTMSFGAVLYENKEVKDLGVGYLQSKLPCPVDCGGDSYLLWNR